MRWSAYMPDGRQRKASVRQAFNRAASTYDAAAAVQREICERLARLAPPAEGGAPRVLDAGCGTGYGLHCLARLHPRATVIALDFAPAMLAHLPPDRPALPLCGDLEALPVAGGSIDRIWSSLALQWCRPDTSLRELHRVLRPGGLACIATLGPRTLHELRDAFAAVDDDEHVIAFHPPEQWADAARDAGFEVLRGTREDVHALSADLKTLLRDIKAIGAHTVGDGRRTRPLGRKAFETLAARYEARRRADGLLPATYDLILLILRKAP